MIRIYTVFSQLYKLSLTDRQWLAQDCASFKGLGASCPHCGAKSCLKEFGYYERYLIELESGEPGIHRVGIKRYRCPSCRHTHDLLSSCLVPYRSYSLRFILTVLYSYMCRHKTVEQLCSHFGIQPSTLYAWKKVYMKQKEAWLGVLKSLYRSGMSFIEGLTGKEVEGFYEKFRFSFLERIPRTDREVSFIVEGRGRGVT